MRVGNIVRATYDFRIAACNARTPRGNRCHKDRRYTTNETFTVIRLFQSTGMATHNDPCATIQDREGYLLDLRQPEIALETIKQESEDKKAGEALAYDFARWHITNWLTLQARKEEDKRNATQPPQH